MNSLSGRRWFRPALGLLVSAALAVWILYSIDLDQVADSLAAVHWYYLPILAGAYLFGFIFRALRWSIMLRPVKPVGFRACYGLIFIGFMANNLLPARAGEIVRAVSLKANQSISGVTGLASIMMERILDGLVLVLLLGLGVLLAPDEVSLDPTVRYVGKAALALFAGVLALVLLAKLRAGAVSRLAMRLLPAGRARETGRKVLDSGFQALEFLRFDLGFLLVVLLSLLVWLAEGAMFYLALPALNLPASPDLALLTLTIVNFGLLIPSLPGYVGIFQGGVILAFGLFAISRETALTYSLVVHFLQYLLATGIGLYYLHRLGLSLTLARKSVRSQGQ